MIRIALIALFIAAPAAAAPIFGVRTDLPGPINPLSVAISDLNDDGNLDLVLGSPGSPPTQGLLTSWFGRGDGYFYPGPTTDCVREPDNLLAARFDGDAFSDVATTVWLGTSGAIQVLRGAGDGSFVESALLSTPVYHHFGGLASADLDGDGVADLAASHNLGLNAPETDGAVYLYSGAGDGTFAAPRKFGGSAGNDVAIRDLNSDGTLDLAIAANDRLDAFFYHVPGDDWVPGTGGLDEYRLVALGQFDGDGVPDQAYAIGTQPFQTQLAIRLSSSGSSYKINLPSVSRSLVATDLDDDGHDDLLTLADFPGRVEFRAGIGDGTFAAPVSYLVGARPYDLAVRDVNGDGLLDFAVANNGSASVTVLLQGNPVIGAGVLPPTFGLSLAYPNPARGAVNFVFELESEEPCALSVHDVSGRLVESRSMEHPTRGGQLLRMFENARPAAGLYFVKLRQGEKVATRSFVVLP